jgi:hypothetical protein
MPDRRHEPRIRAEIQVRIWGLDAKGFKFAQIAIARNISFGGALVSGIELRLRPEDLIGIQYGEKEARFRVVWARDSGGDEKNQAAVQKLDGYECPWKEILEEHAATRATGAGE